MALPVFASFSAMLLLTVLTSIVSTPANIIADAAVMAASTHVGGWMLIWGVLTGGAACCLRLPYAALCYLMCQRGQTHSWLACLAALPCLQPGDYGRLRTWASFAWTAFAPLAGWVNSSFGIRWADKLEGGKLHCRAMGLSSG
jgi:hypothetical protein